MEKEVMISASHLKKSFRIGWNKQSCVIKDVSLDINKGETLALVGESGCGKSTLARLLLRMLKADEGTILFENREISGLSEKNFRSYRREMQMVFQDPASSLDPRMKVRDIIAEPLKAWHVYNSRKELEERVLELVDMVELRTDCLDRYPHQFSGGQRQRIGIARAIALNPKLLVCDESVSALDVCVQAQILNLLKTLKKQMGLTCLFISHDLSVVSFIADRVCVMKDGRICETAPAAELYANPQNEYTKYLLSSVPQIIRP
ncbi:ATP-binding cassette domain-containing protein [Butyrivibrio sp. XPD2002]|uniref:ATP-binding cassette domain-containing protein n=1 Tax=Butyrivibrio sp. XPD2002 TaxID=1280665 RepID=UPI000418F51A|nr:ATP-binding cassette domain-containing protein [Butyrivibrio sp. XPD2002]